MPDDAATGRYRNGYLPVGRWPSLLGGRVLLVRRAREQPVQAALGLGQDGLSLGDEGGVAGHDHGLEGHAHLADRAPDNARVDPLGALVRPVVPDLRGVRVDLGGLSARGRETEGPGALVVEGLDETLVLELVEGGVDRPRAGPPGATAALCELRDDLVAVARLLGKELQDGGADVAAPGPTSSEVAPRAERAVHAHRATGSERTSRTERASGTHRAPRSHGTACSEASGEVGAVLVAAPALSGSALSMMVCVKHVSPPVAVVRRCTVHLHWR